MHRHVTPGNRGLAFAIVEALRGDAVNFRSSREIKFQRLNVRDIGAVQAGRHSGAFDNTANWNLAKVSDHLKIARGLFHFDFAREFEAHPNHRVRQT